MTYSPTGAEKALLRRAEEKFNTIETFPEPAALTATLETSSSEKTKQLLHELRLQKVGLVMQNEELRRTQHELTCSRARYLSLYDLAPVGYLTINRKGLIMEANLTLATLLGLPRAELLKQPLTRFIRPVDMDAHNLRHKECLESGAALAWEMWIVAVDGSLFWAYLQASQECNGEYLITLSDITKRKQAEDALAESEQRFSIFMEHLPLGVFIKDKHCRILFANRYYKDLLGVEKLIGKTTEELYPPGTAAKMIADDRQAIAEGLMLREEIVRDAYGDDRKLDFYKFPIPQQEGTTLLGGVCLDITARRLAEEALALKQQQLEALNQSQEIRIVTAVAEVRRTDDMLIQQGRLVAMGEMVNNIAHQWRQPLNNLALIIQNMQSSCAAGELTAELMDQDVASAMGVITHMSDTIDVFRNFFVYEKEPTVFNVNQIVSAALDFVSPTLNVNGIKVELTEQADISAKGYPNEYLQALLNILNNAKDALLEFKVVKPIISICIRRENDRSLVTIRDNGGGISEDILAKIFDAYFTTKDHGKGTGIGLYMSKKIIENNMAGSLSVCNVAGGAEFRIEL